MFHIISVADNAIREGTGNLGKRNKCGAPRRKTYWPSPQPIQKKPMEKLFEQPTNRGCRDTHWVNVFLKINILIASPEPVDVNWAALCRRQVGVAGQL